MKFRETSLKLYAAPLSETEDTKWLTLLHIWFNMNLQNVILLLYRETNYE